MNISTEELKFNYDESFTPSKEYLKNMPDLQDGNLIKGAKVGIEKVGISNFHLPLKIRQKEGGYQEIEASIVGTVSLEGVKKGINMSRIIRTFYEYKDEDFSIDKLMDVVTAYTDKLGSYDAHIMLSFKYRMWQESLRSVKEDGTKNGGWQYYNVTFEVTYNNNKINKQIHFDFVYSSACPCSTELSLYAMESREQYAIPHSQRSIARISIQMGNDIVWIEDLVNHCRESLKTETLVFCKREDEQAFAELNAANTKFVEDAVRLVYEQLSKDKRIVDFKVIASHNESLHSHDAIAVITKGVENSIYTDRISVADLKSLIY